MSVKQQPVEHDKIVFTREQLDKLYRHHNALAAIYGAALGKPEYTEPPQRQKDKQARQRRLA